MRKVISKIALLLVFLATSSFTAQAANYYWRAVAANNLFSNIANWETAPGGGVSPALAPSINDDVFFPVPSNFGTTSGSPILLNNSNCRDFNVTSATGNFFFSGILTAINGSIDCPNGNAVFNFGADQEVTGQGVHTINLGTTIDRITSGRLVFANSVGMGTYSLTGPLIGRAGLVFETQNFNSNGFPITCRRMSITGTTPKTLDFSNSAIIVENDNAGMIVEFASSHTTTTYIFTNSSLTMNLTTSSTISGIRISPGVQVNLNQLTLNSNAISRKSLYFYVPLTSTTPAILGINLLQLNVPNLALGISGFDNTSSGAGAHGILNVGTLEYLSPNTMLTDRSFTLNVDAIVEAPSCAGQSAMICTGYRALDLNTSSPIATSTIAYAGVNFGGSGISTSATNDLGNNTGTVSWSAATVGTTFWWVGGTGNWEDPTKWSILGSGGAPQAATGCLPTLNDDVVLDAGSFSGIQNITLGTANGFCKNLTWTGSNQGGLLGGLYTGSVSFSGNLFVNGNADFIGARAVGANLFLVGSGSHTLNSPSFAPYTSPIVRFAGTGTYTLTNDLVGSATATYLQHTAGTLNTGGFSVDIANFSSRSLPELASNPRILTVTNSDINIRATTGAGGRRTIDVSFLTAFNATGSEFLLHSSSATTYFSVMRGNASPVYLGVIDFNDISFTSPSCTPSFLTVGSTYTVNFNNANFSSNCYVANQSASITHNVNNYNLTSGYTYFFNSGTVTYNVLGGINTVTTGCQELVRIQSQTLGSQARINKAVAPFNVDGAIVAEINSIGQTMNVINGVDGLGNTNVIVTPGAARTMYWVNDQGDWSDGSNHWSIGLSGGNPAITNPLGCIPRAIDNVIFDLNSFSLPSQTVTLDIDGNCRNMLWTAAAGSLGPSLAGVLTQELNIYGSIELGAGMLSPFLGQINMLGTNLAANTQTIDVNGVSLNSSFILSGGGRYDLTDSVRIVSAAKGFQLRRANFVTNGHNIYCSGMYLDVRGANAADIRNSKIIVFGTGTNVGTGGNVAFQSLHDAVGSWQAAGSDIQTNASRIIINNSAPITYHKVTMNSITVNADLSGSAVQPVFFNCVDWIRTPNQASDGSLMDGVFTMDTLRYPPSSFNTLRGTGARTYNVMDTLIIVGTPCLPAFIRSQIPGSTANLNSNTCNFDLKFVNLREINAATCTTPQNRTVGVDEGGNINWTLTGIGAITPLGNDTAIICSGTPFPITASGFGNVDGMSYLWNTGATAQNISTTTAGTYSVVVTYAPGCTASDEIVVTCLPPLASSISSLRGQALASENILDWESFSEIEQAVFEVQRSADGNAFDAIGEVQTAGLEHQGRAYSFSDQLPLEGLQYYRLRIVGVSGTIGYSNSVALRRNANNLVCYPNPTRGALTIDAEGLGGDLSATFYNVAGQAVARFDWDGGRKEADLSGIPNAIYTLVVRDRQGIRATMRIQVQR